MRFKELRCKEVINLSDGSRLGRVCDMDFTLPEGKITGISVPGRPKFFGLFCRGEDIRIDWQDIKKIGNDAILVCIEGYVGEARKGGFFASIFK